MGQSQYSYIDTDTAPTSYVNANSSNLAAAATSQQIADLEEQLSDSANGVVARVIHLSGNYVKVKWFKNNKTIGMYKARGHTLAKATGALEYYKANKLGLSPIDAITVTIDDNTVAIAGTAQLTVTAADEAEEETDVTTKSVITASPTGKVTIDADGVLTGVEGDVKAQATLTVTDTFSNDETVTIGNKTYTFKTALTPAADEVLIGASAAASLDNLKSAVNGTAGAGTTYGTGTVAHTQVDATTNTDTTQLFVAKLGGTHGNAYASTETATNASFGGATFASGTAAAVTVTATYGGETDDVAVTVG